MAKGTMQCVFTRVCVCARGPFGLMSRRVLAGAPAIVPQVSAILAGCPTSEHEPPAPASS
eukprot:1159596-Pelagomonas_calceolata.AAC.10